MMVSSSAFKTFILKLSAHDEANHFFFIIRWLYPNITLAFYMATIY